MLVKQFPVGGDRNFAYLVADSVTGQAAAVDVSYEPHMVWEFARTNGYQIVYLLSTHGHGDHTYGNAEMEALCGRPALRFGDRDPLTGLILADGVELPLGNLRMRVIHTPGHSPDSMCLYVPDPAGGPGILLTGDTLFVGKVGGTDFGAGARAEYESLHRLMTLPDDTRVLPGHDYGVAPESTIAHERQTNPFLLQPDFDSFVWLKKNWLAYKQEHGIV